MTPEPEDLLVRAHRSPVPLRRGQPSRL